MNQHDHDVDGTFGSLNRTWIHRRYVERREPIGKCSGAGERFTSKNGADCSKPAIFILLESVDAKVDIHVPEVDTCLKETLSQRGGQRLRLRLRRFGFNLLLWWHGGKLWMIERD